MNAVKTVFCEESLPSFYNQVAVRLVLLVIVVNKLGKNFFINKLIPSRITMIFCYKAVSNKAIV